MLCISILLCLLAGVFAEEMKNGHCPVIHTGDYSISNMIGAWYEYKRSQNIRNHDVKCPQITLVEPNPHMYKLITKFYISSTSTGSTITADVNVSGKALGFTADVPILGPIYRSVAFLAVESDMVVIYSCENRGSQHIEYAWVVTSSTNRPLPHMDDRIRNAFSDRGLHMPHMYTNDFEDCLEIFASYKLQPPETPTTLTLACFFNAQCFSEKLQDLFSSFSLFLPWTF